MKGKIRNIVKGKLFGFIAVDDKEYFFHKADYLGDFAELEKESLHPLAKVFVEFDPEMTAKGPRAYNVRKI